MSTHDQHSPRWTQLYHNLQERETQDLLDIWQYGTPDEWEAQVFEVIESILHERAVELPPLTGPRAVAKVLGNVQSALKAQQTDQALRLLAQALQLMPGQAALYYARGELYAELDQTTLALEDYRQALRLEPGLIPAWEGLRDAEQVLEQEFQDSPAKQTLDQALEHAYDDESELARECIAQVSADLPPIALAQNYLGLVHETLGDLEPALQAYRQAIELNPHFYAARENLANVTLRWEHEQFRRLAQADPLEDLLFTSEDGTVFTAAELEAIPQSEAPLPQWLYMDEKAILLKGWPGHRTRQGRSGYDPLDSDFELAHIQGVFLSQLLRGRIRTRNPLYLSMMAAIGLICCFPLLGACTLLWADWHTALYALLFSPVWLAGISLLVNVWLSLATRPVGRQEKDEDRFFV